VSAPFLLGAVLEHHIEKESSKWGALLLRGSYVDNYVIPIEREDEFHPAVREIRELFQRGGFNCRQFGSNLREKVNELPPDWQETRENLSLLGIQWDTVNDQFYIKLPEFGEREVTKRSILSFIAGVFDPCGWVSPILLRAKNLQAVIWKLGMGWDEEVDEEICLKWKTIAAEWKGVEIAIPRCPFKGPHSMKSFEIHGFADASGHGLGFCIYLKPEGSEEVALIFAKSLVISTSLKPKPKKNKEGEMVAQVISMTRIELQAVKLLTKAVKQIQKHITVHIKRIVLWTDASTVILWLNKGTHRQVFVENRLKNIREFEVRHIRSEENPADYASRGISPSEFKRCSNRWFCGPYWVAIQEEDWEVSKFVYEPGVVHNYEDSCLLEEEAVLAACVPFDFCAKPPAISSRMSTISLLIISSTLKCFWIANV
jgi:hypothetical protein